MAKAADNTIAFVKEWIEDKLNKRQYMHYYIVKTPHAQFLMKANEQPDLVAIKDASGHVYVPDSTLFNYTLQDERTLRNPVFALIADGFEFSYSLLEESSFNGGAGTELSKWKTLDRIEVLNTNSDINVNISLVQIGDKRYITEMPFNTDKTMSVKGWANYEDVKERIFKEHIKLTRIQPYTRLREVAGKPVKVGDVRGAYLEYAGKQAAAAIISEEWIYIPTEKNKLNEVADENILATLKTRPMAYHYGLTSDIINVEKAWQRTEYPFYPEQLQTYRSSENFINLNNLPSDKDFVRSGQHWREWLRKHVEYEMAESLIKFIDEDDAWLSDNGYIMLAFAGGRKFKESLFRENLNGYILVVEESNPSLCDKHVVYMKGSVLDTYGNREKLLLPNFTKVIPAPHHSNPNGIEEFTTYVRG